MFPWVTIVTGLFAKTYGADRTHLYQATTAGSYLCPQESWLLPEWLPIPIKAVLGKRDGRTPGYHVTCYFEPALGTPEVSGVHAQPQGP